MHKTLIYKEDLMRSISKYCPAFLVDDCVKRCIQDAPPVESRLKEEDLIYLRHLLFNRQLEISEGIKRGYVSNGEKERISRLHDALSDEITHKAERSLHEAIFPEKPEYLEKESLKMSRDPDREISNTSEGSNLVEVPKGIGIPYVVIGSTGLYMTKEYADVNMKLDSLNDLVKEMHHGE